MSGFEELVAVLQVGTRRANLPELGAIGEWNSQSVERRAMVSVGVLDLMNRAGVLPIDGIQRLEPTPVEECSVAAHSVEPLLEAIESNLSALVCEWAAQARRRNKVAPPAALVKLLPFAERFPEVAAVLGHRGRWLAALQGLDFGTPKAEGLGASSTAEGAELRATLAEEFDAMDWKERAQAVVALRSGLSLADEPILERALSDRRKEVREPAYDMLATLEGSRVAQELTLLTQPILVLEKSLLRRTLAVHPPEPDSLPKSLPRTPSRADFGPKALALFDVVRFVPPKNWVPGISIEQLLGLAADSEYSGAILNGLQEAAVRFSDQEWIDALFAFYFDRDALKQERWGDLSQRTSEPLFERLVSAGLESSNAMTAASSLSVRRRPLSAALSRVAVITMRTQAAHHYRLRDLATQLDLSALTLIDAPYGDNEEFEKTRLHLYKVMNLRRRLISSLDD